ncbi:GAF and ANTAR domain-containing protein [Streptomyces javensis]|uniref:GAF and ANTAR domain-containing protein n=1 Tax=Streptomyces javensis TaxID=114698 RepID=UPI00281211FB|nr:ANTAR domain-containing protein [Streptomyces javensis]
MIEDDGPSDSGRDGAAEEQRRIADELTGAIRGVPLEELPSRLCEVCLRLLPVTGMSLSVQAAGPGMEALLCASDKVAAQLAEIQYTLGEGPRLQAHTLHAPVFAADLLRGPEVRRWPVFAAQAVRAGAQAVFSLPLGSPVAPLGTMDLYRRAPGSLSSRDVRVALLTADAVNTAIGTLDGRTQDSDKVVAWLEGAEADRDEVHQAIGMIMVRLSVDAEEALARLRARAFVEGRTATEVARAVVNRTLDITDHD